MERLPIEHKIFETEVKEFDEKDLTVVHFISSERRDRGGDILYAGPNERGRGMIMEGRPVVLHSHGFGPLGQEPIAKPIWIKQGEFKGHKGIMAKTQFYDGSHLNPPDNTGRRLWEKTTQHIMPSWSIGWRPIAGKMEIKRDADGEETRHVYEWELLEFSIVSVPMQPDAQTLGMNADALLFKMIPENEEKLFGELIAWKKNDGNWEEKPYPSEHACRILDPSGFDRIRRQNNKFGKGVHAIWGVKSGKPVELQAIRFDKSKFTPAEAKKWVKDHEYKCKLFEAASEKCADCGDEMTFKQFIENPDDGIYSCDNCKSNGKNRCKCDNEKCQYIAKWSKNCDGMKCLKCGTGKLRIIPDKSDMPEVKQFERWNKSLPTAFDEAMKDRPPASWEYDLYRKFLKCEIKDIFLHTFEMPSAMIGTYLSAIKELTKGYKIHDTRRFTSDGAEMPPKRDVIRLNSTKTDDFLISGIQFFTTDKGSPLILKFTPYWSGMGMDIVSEAKQTETSKAFLQAVKDWAKANNFLKGEKFALSGDFLEKSDEEMKDLIADDETKAIIRKAISQVNTKGGEMGSRGFLFCGHPGTGKTKTGRIMMNDCEATFIWVSAKDFGYSSSGTIGWAFSMAKELAPTVLFVEDIDTWMGSHMVDVMKTEMDGLRQNKGVLTVLTSNNPELLPDALIDRPGRFHHVLDFKLPNAKQRATMLSTWIGDKGDSNLIQSIADKTAGFSGAHLKELVDFAKIISEEDGVADINKALVESLKRLMKQKELIDQIRRNHKEYMLPKIVGEIETKEIKGIVVPYKRTIKATEGDEANWNMAEEINKAKTDDLKEMAVWYDEKKAELKSSYKGIHHLASNGYPVIHKAVRNVAKKLMNARGGIHISTGQLKQAREHIGKHYEDLQLGKPPWASKEWEEFCGTAKEFKVFVDGPDTVRVAEKQKEERDKMIFDLAQKMIPEYADLFDPSKKQDQQDDDGDWGEPSDGSPTDDSLEEADLTEPEQIKIRFIDGDALRDKDDPAFGGVDFTMGGHHYVYDGIPEDEVWIDERMNNDDIAATKMHEVFERQLMKYHGYSYNEAHDGANMIEKITRHLTDTSDEGGGPHTDEQHHWFKHYGDHHHTEGYTPGTVDHPWEDVTWGDGVAKMAEPQKAEFVKELKANMNIVAKKYGLIPGSPAPEEKKTENPPDAKRVVVVVDSASDAKKAEEEKQKRLQAMAKDIGEQLNDVINRVVPRVVQSEMDRIRGKIPETKPIVPVER